MLWLRIGKPLMGFRCPLEIKIQDITHSTSLEHLHYLQCSLRCQGSNNMPDT